MSELVSIQQAAARCRVTERTVRRWIASGRLKSVMSGRRQCVSLDELAPFLDSAGRADADVRTQPDTGADMSGPSRTVRTSPDMSVISDALHLVEKLQQENRDLAGQVGYYQAQLEQLKEQLALTEPEPEMAPESAAEPEAAPRPAGRVWWRFWSR